MIGSFFFIYSGSFRIVSYDLPVSFYFSTIGP